MRLIDADALIEAINRSTCNWTEYLWKQVVCDVVNNQPTAYDVEKVIAELENRKEESKKCYVEAMAEANCSLASRFHGEREAYNNSINIIRKGGTT